MQDFRKYGIENFTFEILDTFKTYNDMIKAEQEYILQENSIFPTGYNQTNRTDTPMLDPNISKKMSQTKRTKYGKIVAEIDENNQILSIWNSIVEASEETSLDRYKISDVCNGRRLTTGGRRFRFIDESKNIIEPEKRTNITQSNRITKSSKKVIKLNENNEILQVYDSIALAAKDNNCDSSGISKVCNGKRTKCGGFKWQYQT